jgi:hypothetical protein
MTSRHGVDSRPLLEWLRVLGVPAALCCGGGFYGRAFRASGFNIATPATTVGLSYSEMQCFARMPLC